MRDDHSSYQKFRSMQTSHRQNMNLIRLKVNGLSMKCDFQKCCVFFIFEFFYTSFVTHSIPGYAAFVDRFIIAHFFICIDP